MNRKLLWIIFMDKTRDIWAEREAWWDKHYPVN